MNEDLLNIEIIKEYKIEDKYVSRVDMKTSKKDFVKNLDTNGSVKVFTSDGAELSDDDFVGTGMILQVSRYGDVYEFDVAVMGDFSGDGKVTAQDLSTMNAAVLDLVSLDGALKLAGDIDENGRFSATDLSEVNRMVLQ